MNVEGDKDNNSFLLLLQQISNNHQSPGKMYPEMGSAINKYVKRAVGDVNIMPKEPMFRQDFEHILDVVGLGNDASLQRK